MVRDSSRATDLLAAAERLHVAVRLLPITAMTDAPGLVISTVPAGAADGYAERIRVTGRAPAAVLDVVYDPWPTPLAEAATAAGAVVASGFAMLLHQAAAQVELMTGKPAPLEAMRAAGEAELARRTAVHYEPGTPLPRHPVSPAPRQPGTPLARHPVSPAPR